MKKFTVLIIVAITLLTSAIVFSQSIPQTINYQGVLKDASGVVIADGDYNITFKLYDVETSGTELWTETKLINVVDGIINTQIGSVTPLSLPFDEGYWLGVTVSTGSEMAPRIKLTSVPYSFMTMNVMDASITTAKIQDNAVTSSKVLDNTLTALDIADNQLIKTVNGLKDSVNIVAGSNVTITPSGNTLTIAATSGSSGTITGVTAGTGLEGGGTSGVVTLSIAETGITNTMLSENSVTSTKILDGTITSADISDGTLTATDISNNQVVKKVNGIRDSVNLVAGSNISITPSGNTLTITSTGGTGNGDITAVTAGTGLTGGGTTGDVTLSIANDGVTNGMLQTNSVMTQEILDGTITINDLGDNSVTSAKVVDGTLTSADILDGTITTSDLTDNSISTAKILDGTITTMDLATGSVTADDIATDGVTTTEILNGTITATDIGNTQVVKSLNTLKDNVTLVAGNNIAITPSGQNLTISSTSSGLGGSGTVNYVPLFTGSTTLGNSNIFQTSEGNVGIGTTTPTGILDVQGGSTSADNGRGINLISETGYTKSGDINLQTGNVDGGFLSGNINLRTGYGSGEINILSGSGNSQGGNINIQGGWGGGDGGNINISSGIGGNQSGNVNINTGPDGNYNSFSGSILIHTATNNEGGAAGGIDIFTGNGDSGNAITLKTGVAYGSGNSITLKTGATTVGAGDIILEVDSTNFSAYGQGNIILTPNPGGLVKINGSGTYTGSWTQASDRRFKKNVEIIENAVDKVQQLNGVSYEFKSDEFPEKNFDEGKQIGLIAQDVEKIFPELVKTDSEGYKSVAYQNMVAVLIEAVKELKAENDNLRENNEELLTRLERIEKYLGQTAMK